MLSDAVKEGYEKWLTDPVIDEATKEELRAIAGDEREIEDRFYRDLEFGTGGLRGLIGAGTNRMNRYTVGRVTQGLAQYVISLAGPCASVAIAYDSRHQSPEFALEAALVLAGNGVKAYIFESLRPTPELSYTVRRLGATAGIVITASHNPSEYNGYKVYDADGGQLVPDAAERVMAEIAAVSTFHDVTRLDQGDAEAAGWLHWIGTEMDSDYIEAVLAASPNPGMAAQSIASGGSLSIVYSPLHGSGNVPVRTALAKAGFRDVHIVAEQESPDPNFSTVVSPNPEERSAFALAIELGKQVGADLLLATDPDCDRVGAAVNNGNGEYVVLNGNQMGAILAEYIFESLSRQNKLPENAVMIKTIVTSEFGAAIAKHYGVSVLNTLTGFKYIGEKMTEFERTGEYSFVFGYEESYGYLAGMYARDKDAVLAALLISEAALYYKQKGSSLYETLLRLYERHGYFIEALESRTLKGKDGLEKMDHIMKEWRADSPAHVSGFSVAKRQDYLVDEHRLPLENVLKFTLSDGSWFCLRPSGTEPKLKVYFAVNGADEASARSKCDNIIREVMARVDGSI